ncbi:MAG TPA: hypothetical protein VMB47_01935 [Candidatus Aquilonibacter sp.]|nr:hypothetical protein [Candidatus Aquilonibacter sp.]
MNFFARNLRVHEAAEDLRRRTLAQIGRPLDRLIYLASMRDYNTGLYYHDGLASKFGDDVACEAIAECHREAFHELVSLPLEVLVGQMESYMKTMQTAPSDFLAMWKGIEPYRVAVPVGADQLAIEFLFSNFRIALSILGERLHGRRPMEPGASLPQLPVQ